MWRLWCWWHAIRKTLFSYQFLWYERQIEILCAFIWWTFCCCWIHINNRIYIPSYKSSCLNVTIFSKQRERERERERKRERERILLMHVTMATTSTLEYLHRNVKKCWKNLHAYLISTICLTRKHKYVWTRIRFIGLEIQVYSN